VVAAHRRRWDAESFEDPPDGGRADPVAQAAQLALDALVAPAGVVAGHLLDQGDDGRVERRPSGPVREGPMPGDQPPVPGQDRGRGDDPVRHQVAGEEPDQGGERGPVGPAQSRLEVRSAQDRVLVAEDEDLNILGRAAAGQQGQPFGGAAEREVEQA
jgi:hypothetical protein